MKREADVLKLGKGTGKDGKSFFFSLCVPVTLKHMQRKNSIGY